MYLFVFDTFRRIYILQSSLQAAKTKTTGEKGVVKINSQQYQ